MKKSAQKKTARASAAFFAVLFVALFIFSSILPPSTRKSGIIHFPLLS